MEKLREYTRMTKEETRPCEIVDDHGNVTMTAYFHMWFTRERRTIYEPESGVLMALIESEYGKMGYADAYEIRFTDRQTPNNSSEDPRSPKSTYLSTLLNRLKKYIIEDR